MCKNHDVPIDVKDSHITVLVTARCDGRKVGEQCDFMPDPDCLRPDVCPGLKIVKAAVVESDVMEAT